MHSMDADECLILQAGDAYMKLNSFFPPSPPDRFLKAEKMAKQDAEKAPSVSVPSDFLPGTGDTLDYLTAPDGQLGPKPRSDGFPPSYGIIPYRGAMAFIKHALPEFDSAVTEGCRPIFLQEDYLEPMGGQELYAAGKSCGAITGWTPLEWTKVQFSQIFRHDECAWEGPFDPAAQCLMLKDGDLRVKLAPYLDKAKGGAVPRIYMEKMIPKS